MSIRSRRFQEFRFRFRYRYQVYAMDDSDTDTETRKSHFSIPIPILTPSGRFRYRFWLFQVDSEGVTPSPLFAMLVTYAQCSNHKGDFAKRFSRDSLLWYIFYWVKLCFRTNSFSCMKKELIFHLKIKSLFTNFGHFLRSCQSPKGKTALDG